MPTWDENLEENEDDVFGEWEASDKRTFSVDGSVHRMREVFRTEKLDESTETLTRQSRQLHAWLLLAIPVSLCLGLLVHVAIEAAGFWNCVEVGALLAVLTTAFCFIRGTPVPVRQAVIYLNAAVAVYFLVYALDNRTLAAAILGTGSFLAFLKYGKGPLDFYHEWIFAGSGVDPEQWIDAKRELTLHPSAVKLAVILSIAVIVPAIHSVSLAIILVLLFCLAFSALSLSFRGRPLSNLQVALAAARKILLLYSAYPDTDAFHIWTYSQSQGRRRKHLTLLWMLLAVTIAIALSYCIPFEIFASWFQRGFYWPIPPAKQHHAFEWLVMPLAMMLTAGRRYAWAFVIGAVLSYVLPYLILFTIYLPSILRIEEVARTFARAKNEKPDGRTFFQRYVDVLRASYRTMETGDELEI